MESKNPENLSEAIKRSEKDKKIIAKSVVFLGVLMLLMVCGVPADMSKIIFQNMPKIISSLHKKELKQAEWCASRSGFANMMEEHLIKAEWDAREKGVDISEEVKEIYAKGSLSVLESALSRALYGHTDSAKYDLIKYKRFCSKAEIPPDDKKIAEVEMIIQRN